MDLLEEDEVVTSSPNAVASDNVRKQSRDEKQPTAVVRPTTKEPSVDRFAKYLEQSQTGSQQNLTPEFTDNATKEDSVERDSEPEGEGEGAASSAQQNSELAAVPTSPEEGSPGDQTYTVPEEEVRIFIALYDYDPVTMSPNPGAEDEELSFKEGDLVKVRASCCTTCKPRP